jgi:hypothetical protein
VDAPPPVPYLHEIVRHTSSLLRFHFGSTVDGGGVAHLDSANRLHAVAGLVRVGALDAAHSSTLDLYPSTWAQSTARARLLRECVSLDLRTAHPTLVRDAVIMVADAEVVDTGYQLTLKATALGMVEGVVGVRGYEFG